MAMVTCSPARDSGGGIDVLAENTHVGQVETLTTIRTHCCSHCISELLARICGDVKVYVPTCGKMKVNGMLTLRGSRNFVLHHPLQYQPGGLSLCRRDRDLEPHRHTGGRCEASGCQACRYLNRFVDDEILDRRNTTTGSR